MLRRSFLQGTVVSPLLALFPFTGKQKSQQPRDEVKPVEPTSRFHVFIPARTRADHEELHRIGCNAALEIAAYEHANEDCHPGRVRDCRLKYIRNENRDIHEVLLVELDSIRGNGKIEWAECLSNTGVVCHPALDACCRCSPYVRHVMKLKQASFRQKVKETMCWIGGEQTFHIARLGKESGENNIYHIDVPEQAAAAIEHIDRVEKVRPEDQHLRDMCRWFRDGIRIQTVPPRAFVPYPHPYLHMYPSYPQPYPYPS